MRHRRAGRRLNRSSGQRKALFRNLTVELFDHEVIHTTDAKAKAIRPQAEKLISLAKRGVLGNRVHAQRLAMARLNNEVVVRKLFNEIAPRYASSARRLRAYHPTGTPQGRWRRDGPNRVGRGVDRREWRVESGEWRGRNPG